MTDLYTHELKVFYCYARTDQDFRNQLEEHLSNLKRLYDLKTWFDRQIKPGDNWKNTIEEQLNSADLILLLISPAFMASEYCYSKEMQHALDRHAKGQVKVIPILIRYVHWRGAPFSHLQILPTDAKPVKSWADIDEAFYDVALGIEKVVQGLLIQEPLTIKNDENNNEHLQKASPLETLTNLYEAVRRNSITDPSAILDLAQRFDELANDPLQRKIVAFDATRAADSLRQRAQKLREL